MAITNLGEFENVGVVADNPGLQRVLQVFHGISSFARPSKREEAVRVHLIELAREQGWDVVQDKAGNVAFRVPASPGMEEAMSVVLQGHMDIVASGEDEDLPRNAVIVDKGNDGDEQGLWLQTENQDMTLGADNGIGVSLAVAAMMDPDLKHGPVTILLTVDEERGMTGAQDLDPRLLPEAGILVNLDSEEGPQGICIGCAGNGDMVSRFDFETVEVLPEGYVVAEVDLSGFPGGHSGVMIHGANGNAIQSLARLLQQINGVTDLKVLSVNGGTKPNAIPDAAKAIVALPESGASQVEAVVDSFLADLRHGEGVEDWGMTGVLRPERANSVVVKVSPVSEESLRGGASPVVTFSREFQARLLSVLSEMPTGPFDAAELPNVGKLVTLSNNLGLVKTDVEGVEVVNMARGADVRALTAKMVELKNFLLDRGAHLKMDVPTSGWLEDPENSSAVAAVVEAVNEVVGQSQFLAYHAGLEAGLVAGKRPGGLSAVAIGPWILDAHTRRERVSLDSVDQELAVLKYLLANV